jgi:hypothetical protein
MNPEKILRSLGSKMEQPVTGNPFHSKKPVPVSIGQKEPGLNRLINYLLYRNSLFQQFCNFTKTEVESISKPEIRKDPETPPFLVQTVPVGTLLKEHVSFRVALNFPAVRNDVNAVSRFKSLISNISLFHAV